MAPAAIYRISQALVEQFIAGFSRPPKNLILDMDHSEDAVHGQQPLAFYNHHYRSTCYLPLMIVDGQSGALVARRRFPDTHILVRGDGHFSGPELMGLIDSMPNIDFVFGFSSNPKLLKLAEPTRLRACSTNLTTAPDRGPRPDACCRKPKSWRWARTRVSSSPHLTAWP